MITPTKYLPFLFGVILLVPLILGVICLFQANSLLQGYDDCSNIFDMFIEYTNGKWTSSKDALNCLPAHLVTLSNFYELIGTILFILPIGVALLLLWKNQHSDNKIIELIGLTE